LTRYSRASSETIDRQQEHDAVKNALVHWSGRTPEAQLSKVQADRAAVLARIASYDADRASHLLDTDDVAAIDAADMAIASDRRTVAIYDAKIAALERDLRQQAHDRREDERTAAIKVIAGIFARRTAKAAKVVELLNEAVALAHDIKNDENVAHHAWPFADALPEWFTWRHDVGRDLMELLRDAFGNLMPPAVRQHIPFRIHGGGGVTQAPLPADHPTEPRDFAGRLAYDAKNIIARLRTVNIHPAEPLPDDDADEVAA
jgi:hypothetical protein